MDGERLSPRLTAAVERHVAGCTSCAAFEAGAWKLREAARFEVAPAVPDLVDSIMASVERERQERAPGRPPPPPRGRGPAPPPPPPPGGPPGPGGPAPPARPGGR